MNIRILIFAIAMAIAGSLIYADEHDIWSIEQFLPEEAENIEYLQQGIALHPQAESGYIISRPLSAITLFDCCMVSWVARQPVDTDIQVEIRAGSDGKNWSSWSGVAHNEATLNWGGEYCSFIQYRISFHKKPGAETPKLEKLTLMHDLSYCIDIEAANDKFIQELPMLNAVPKPHIVSRSAWGAVAPKNPYSSHTPKTLTIHHTAGPVSQYKGSATIRSIQKYHMDSNGWNDIGYHFVVGTYPQSGSTSIYQGRPEKVIGAHTSGKNTNNVGVCAVGNYNNDHLHSNTYNNLVNLLAWLCYNYRISPDNIYGHRDFNSTACPGNSLYAKIPQIRADVRKKLQGR